MLERGDRPHPQPESRGGLAMRWWDEMKYLVRKLNRKRADQELEEEIRTHLELENQEKIEVGLSPEEARYAAQRALGNTLLIQEQTREVWGWLWLEWLLKDIRYAIRGLFRSPGYTRFCVITSACRRCYYWDFWHLRSRIFERRERSERRAAPADRTW